MSCISQESYTRECSALQRARRLGLLSLASKDTRSNYVCGVLKPWPGRNRTGFFWFSNGRPSTAPQRRLQPPNFVFPTQRGEAAYLPLPEAPGPPRCATARSENPNPAAPLITGFLAPYAPCASTAWVRQSFVASALETLGGNGTRVSMHVSLLRNRCNLILRAVLADVDLRPSSLIGITPFDPPPEHITVLRDLLSSAFHKLIIHILLMTLSPLCVGVLCFCDNRSPNTLFGWGVRELAITSNMPRK